MDGRPLAGIVSLTLVLSLLAIGFRSLPLVVATLITLIAGLIWTAVFAIVALLTYRFVHATALAQGVADDIAGPKRRDDF